MSRAGHLGRGADLDLLLRRGRRISHPWFSVAWRPNGGAENRFVFIVPRTVDKRAVMRNRLRRRMSEFMRRRAAGIRPPLDIAITCRREAAAAPAAQFYASLEELLGILGKK